MPKTVHILPVSSRERVLKSLRESSYPVNKVYLVFEGKKASFIANQIEKELKALIEVEKIRVDSSDIYSAVLRLADAVKKELIEGNVVLINLADNSVKLAMACLIVAQLSGSKLYILDSEIPMPKLRKIGSEMLEVLVRLKEEGGQVISIKKLIDSLEGTSENRVTFFQILNKIKEAVV